MLLYAARKGCLGHGRILVVTSLPRRRFGPAESTARFFFHSTQGLQHERVGPRPAPVRGDRPSRSFERGVEQVVFGFPLGLAPVVVYQTPVGCTRLQIAFAEAVFLLICVVQCVSRRFGRVQQRHRVTVDHVRVEKLVAELRVRYRSESETLRNETHRLITLSTRLNYSKFSLAQVRLG